MIYINARFLSQRITGVQRFAIELSIRLIQSKLNVVFVAPYNVINHDLARELGVVIIGKNTGHIWEQFDLPIYLRSKNKPLLVSFCNTAPLFYSNSIVTIHDLAFLENPKWFSKGFYLAYKILIPIIARKSKSIITVSNFSKNEIVRKLKINPDKINLVYNAVSSQFICEESQEVKQGYVLFVGSLDPRKNMLQLLKAFELLPSGLVLKVVGGASDSFSSFIKQQRIPSDNIVFTGYVSDLELRELYRRASCFVYPSLYEGFGIPPLEAQAAGVPILVSDIPVFYEIFKNSALYCNPQSAESIANGIQRIIGMEKDMKFDFINRGFSNVAEYSWDRSLSMIIDLLEGN